jgi:4-diphosphocytidyl-2C-methyl-D-erythritol kinase
VPTAAAYAAFDAVPRPSGDPRAVLDTLRSQDAALLGAALANNLTDASCQLVPQIGEAISWLRAESDVLGVAMAGSGSSVFALCAQASAAQRLAQEASERGWWAVATRTSPHGASITWAMSRVRVGAAVLAGGDGLLVAAWSASGAYAGCRSANGRMVVEA